MNIFASGLDGLGSLSDLKNVKDADTSSMVSMFGPILQKLEKVNTIELIKQLLKVVVYNGCEDGDESDLSKKGGLSESFDQHFSGNIFLMIKLCIEVVKHNFSDFFQGNSILSK